jgi:hypothetical protein
MKEKESIFNPWLIDSADAENHGYGGPTVLTPPSQTPQQ